MCVQNILPSDRAFDLANCDYPGHSIAASTCPLQFRGQKSLQPTEKNEAHLTHTVQICTKLH